MKSSLFTNFTSKDEKEKTRSKSISSLKSLKLKQIKPNPNIKKINNLSRIYAQDHSTLTKNMIESFSPSNIKTFEPFSGGKILTIKKSNPRLYVSAKSEMSMKKNVYKKRSPIASSRNKQSDPGIPVICIEESLSTTINSSVLHGSSAGNKQKQRFCRFLSTSTIDKLSKDQSVVSNESSREDFRTRVTELFEKFKSNHFEILGSFKCSK
jgi:hypothetical protein